MDALPTLDAEAIDAALEAGSERARELRARGVIEGTALAVQGCWRVLGTPGSTVPALGESADRTDRASVSDVDP